MELAKKDIKRIKQEIITETAVGVGYNLNVIQKIESYALCEAVKEITRLKLIKDNTDHADIQNVIVTESVKATNFQDFKELLPYFFNGQRLIKEANEKNNQKGKK